ncbi:MAG: hypothetical protein Q8R57_09265 [Bacteroidota bacterium]|nr:hypothetical protein [Bacteroidota bacterium]
MKHKILLIFLLFTSTFFSCRKDDDTPCDNKDYHYNLSEEDKSKVPYTGYDTLVFISNTNDTAVCIGQGKKQYYLRTVIPNYTINNCSIPSTDNYEAYNYKFSSNNSKFNIEMNQYRKDEYGSESIYFYFNNIFFILYSTRVGNPNSNNFIDSILIQNNWYKSVSLTSKYFNPLYDKLFYNQEFGILKIQNSDSTEIWELLTKR